MAEETVSAQPWLERAKADQSHSMMAIIPVTPVGTVISTTASDGSLSPSPPAIRPAPRLTPSSLPNTRDPALITIALNLGHGTMFGLESTYRIELFRACVRYTGASLGPQIVAALGYGLSPIVTTALVTRLSSTIGVSMTVVILTAVTFAAALAAREIRQETLAA